MEPAILRIYLSGRIAIDTGGAFLGPEEFPGQQGRAVFAFLVGQRDAPVSRSAVADAIWLSRPPPSWDTALSSIVSKLRSLLSRAGMDGTGALASVGGLYELQLPPGVWIDHEVAVSAIHEAEAALGAGDPARAYGPSAVAQHIARRPFLPGQEGHWFERRREKLAGILIRALECRAEIYLWNREFPLAVEAARDVVALRPFRESAYRLLMRAHASAGNGAEALRVYERCKAVISEELGVNPSPDTQALHAEVLALL